MRSPDQTAATELAPAGAGRKRVLFLLTPSTYRAHAFLKAAERLGLEVVKAIDTPAGLGDHWQEHLALQFLDVEGSTRVIVERARRTPFDAVISVDDSASILAASASAVLGLPHNAPEAAAAARDKHRMRELFAAAGVPSPEYRPFLLRDDPIEIAEQVPYPCVVKPTTLSGSRGVIRANDPAELGRAFNRLKRYLISEGYDLETTPILVERFLPGLEVALEGLLIGGELDVLALFDKPDPLDGPFFEETIYVTPSRLRPEVQAAIARCTAQGAASLGLREGPVHAELRVNDEEPWMIEMAGRSIGGMCSTILQFGSGFSLEEIILRQAVGLVATPPDRERRAAGVMMIPIPKGGILKGVHGVEEARAVPHVEGVEIAVGLNHRIVPLPEGGSYLGFIFARADDPATAEAALREAHARLSFDIAPLLLMEDRREARQAPVTASTSAEAPGR